MNTYSEILKEILNVNTKDQLSNLQKDIFSNHQLNKYDKEDLIKKIDYIISIDYIDKNPEKLTNILAEIIAEKDLSNQKVRLYKLLNILTTKEEINTLIDIVPFNPLDKKSFTYKAYDELIDICNNSEELNNLLVEIMAKDNLFYNHKISLIVSCVDKLISMCPTEAQFKTFKDNILAFDNDHLYIHDKKLIMEQIYAQSIRYFDKNLKALSNLFVEITEQKNLIDWVKLSLIEFCAKKLMKTCVTEDQLRNLKDDISANNQLNQKDKKSLIKEIYTMLIDLNNQTINSPATSIAVDFIEEGIENNILQKYGIVGL